jgi:GT2 family glycosyltransferase
MIELSIIIVNYNTKQLTLGCIDSIYKSAPKINFEIIVVDNASSEAIPISKRHQVIKNKENLGFAKANNQGIAKAKGKYILLLNSDTKVRPGTIEKLLGFAKSHTDAGVVVPRLLNSNGSVQPSVYRFPTLWRAFVPKSLEKYVPKKEVVEVAVMAAYLITPQALKKVGRLNEKYFMYFEDFDYARKLKQAGLKIYYLEKAEVVHIHGASGGVNQMLIESSKKYHGLWEYYLFTFILWTGQKLGKFLPIILLALLTIPAFYQLLKPGYFPMQDDLQAFRVQQMDKCLADLQIPCRWVPDAGYQYGYPQFNYYPPLPYYAGALLHRAGIQYIDSVKILFIAGYLLSAFAMYILASELTEKWSGFIATLLYTFIPYKAVEVYVRGALSEFWAQIFFPLILWSIYKLIKTGKTGYLVLMGLLIALLATTHTLMTMIFAPIAAVWALYWLFEEKWKNLSKVVSGGLFGFGLSAFFVLPVMFERKFVHVESLLSGYFDYRQHFVSLYKLFLSREWGYGSSGFPDEKLNLSLGITLWITALIIAPVLTLFKYRKNKKTSQLIFLLIPLALLSIFMMHLRSSFIWAKLPPLWYLQFPWRFLAVSIFLLCLLAALAIHLAGKFKYLLGIGLVVATFLLYFPFFVTKDWLYITDQEKFSGQLWEKQLTISIFDYLPIYATLPPWQKAPDLPEVLEGKVKFLEYKKGSNFQEGVVEAGEEALARLPLFDFPGMEVQVDGKKVEHKNDDCRGQRYCLGLITFKVPTGRHEIIAELHDTPVRKAGNLITLVSLVSLGFLIVKSNKRLRGRG